MKAGNRKERYARLCGFPGSAAQRIPVQSFLLIAQGGNRLFCAGTVVAPAHQRGKDLLPVGGRGELPAARGLLRGALSERTAVALKRKEKA